MLELKNIVKKFGSLTVLNNINISIKEGDFLVLVGPSGCGKSTLLSIIAGLDEQTGGDVIINGKVVNDSEPKERDIAMVFQSYALYPNMSVEENITFGMKNRKMPPDEIKQRLESVLRMLQIEHLRERKPAQLSGGQRQRVAMGRAIARKPAIYLFDEPLSNLDAKLRVEMRTEIKALHQEVKNTVVYVTHDQTEAMTMADKIALLHNGNLMQIDDPLTIYNKPNCLFVAGFIGSPSMNFIDIIPTQKDGGGIECELDIAGIGKTKIDLSSHESYLGKYAGKTVILGIRPEHLTPKPEEGRKCVPMTIKSLISEPTGADQYLVTKINSANVICRCSPDTDTQIGSNLEVFLHTDMLSFFDRESEKRIE